MRNGHMILCALRFFEKIGKKIDISMRKLVIILALAPMLAMNIAPSVFAVDEANPFLSELIPAENISETAEKSEAEKKFVVGLKLPMDNNKFLSGHKLNDLYAVPPERADLPYEPPIA